MTSFFSKIFRNSIRYKLVAGLATIMLPLIVFLIFNGYYSIRVVHNQVALSYKNMISLYMNQIDNNLDTVDSYLGNLEALNTDLQIMANSKNENEYYLSKIRLNNKMSQDITMYRTIGSMFIYSVSRQDFVEIDNYGQSYDVKGYIKEYIIKRCMEYEKSDNSRTIGWYPQKVGQDYYLFRILKMDDIYIGGWINVKKLLEPMNMTDVQNNGAALFSTAQGEPMMKEDLISGNNINLKLDFNQYDLMGNKTKYLIVGEKSAEGDFNLIALIQDSSILEKLPYLQKGINFISAVLLLLFPIYLLLLRKIILIPLKRMIIVMKQIQGGNLEVRIEPYDTSEEFKIVNDTFNTMVEQIHDLKISVYEEKINRQKSELQHLQLQINPHFFLNSLNIIHTLARGRNYELIQEMTLCLIQYFRYMFKSNLSFVSLKDELKHVRNYIRIQELRFPKSFSYEINAPEYLLDTLVPPLIIHTFAENSIKYAVSLDEPVTLMVDIKLIEDRNIEPCFRIIIQDNGKGYSKEVLDKLNSGNRVVDDQGGHIGIWNVQQRLYLLYKGHAKLILGNAEPHGAVAEITLPMNIDTIS